MNVWTQLEIISNETFKRIQEFALFPPYITSAMYRMLVNIRLKFDFGSVYFLYLLMHKHFK